MPDWTLHHGDALTILPTLTTPIDAVIADPPYNSGGRTMTERTSRTAREKYLTSGGREHGFDLGDFTGDNRDQRSYLAWLSLILAESYRVTRPGGAASSSPTGGSSRPRPMPCRPPATPGAASLSGRSPSPDLSPDGCARTVSSSSGAATAR